MSSGQRLSGLSENPGFAHLALSKGAGGPFWSTFWTTLGHVTIDRAMANSQRFPRPKVVSQLMEQKKPPNPVSLALACAGWGVGG